MERKIQIVRGEDWEGLYIDGELKIENHSLESYDVLAALGIDYVTVEVDDDWLSARGHLPPDLKDVQVFQGSDSDDEDEC